ncbi:metal ABC transporter substrate-binding protein [Porcipelethomonas sp.]|uniref:metal ABC transporter substrate-binding protein n=1 Tax=Porcipelethomonas sp. TaxID=2981675 RepID=UPI003EF6378D
MKNKILSIILSSALIFLLTSCSYSQHSEKLQIVTTIFPQYDFVKQITGGNAEVTLLLTPGSESHTYEPTPNDIAKIQHSDLFIYTGGESEVWVDKVLSSYGNENINSLRLMDFVEPLPEEHNHDEHEHHHHEDEDEEEYDEHIFTSLKNSVTLLNVINNEICSIDSSNSNIYNENTKNYESQITELDNKFEDMIKNSKRKTVIFGDRFPFRYFANDYGLECHAAFSGCSSENEAAPKTISLLINTVKNENVPVIFYIEFSSQIIADKISSATGVKTELLHSCHNISKEDIKNNVTYVDLMTQNYNNLSEALN